MRYAIESSSGFYVKWVPGDHIEWTGNIYKASLFDDRPTELLASVLKGYGSEKPEIVTVSVTILKKIPIMKTQKYAWYVDGEQGHVYAQDIRDALDEVTWALMVIGITPEKLECITIYKEDEEEEEKEKTCTKDT